MKVMSCLDEEKSGALTYKNTRNSNHSMTQQAQHNINVVK